jgi:hypothetical protein
MSISVRVDTSPPLAELLSRPESTSQPDTLNHVGEFLLSRGVAGSQLDQEVRGLIEESGIDTSEGRTSEALRNKLRDLLHPVREKVLGSDQGTITIGAYYLYRPAVKSAKVELDISHAQATTGTVSFKFPAIGGSGEATLTLTQEIHREVTQGSEIISVIVPAKFQRVQLTRDGLVLATYERLERILDNQTDWDFKPLKAPAAGEHRQPPVTVKYNQQSQKGGTTRVKTTVKAGTSWKLSTGVKLPTFGVDLGVDITGETVQEIALTYELPDGHVYVGEQFKADPGYVWTVGSRPARSRKPKDQP